MAPRVLFTVNIGLEFTLTLYKLSNIISPAKWRCRDSLGGIRIFRSKKYGGCRCGTYSAHNTTLSF